MVKEAFSINASDGTRLSGMIWMPEVKPKAAVYLIHGIGEHIERYDHVATAMADRGIGFLGVDLRGHGKSGGKRGHIPSYEKLMEDVRQGLTCVGPSFGKCPTFIYGHSMGGSIAGNFLARMKPEVEGAIITSAWLVLKNPPSSFLVGLGKFMNSVFPKFTQSNGLDVNDISSDKAVVEAYKKDPLVHNKVTARTGIAMLDAADYLMQNAEQIEVPVLLMHGAQDNILLPSGTEEFASRLKVDHEVKIWPGMRHETHNEIGKEEVIEHHIKWIESIVEKKAESK